MVTALAVLAVVIGVIIYIQGNSRRTYRGLAENITRLRALALRPVTYLPLGARDPRNAQAHQAFDAIDHELESAGFHLLDEMLEQASTGRIAGVVRWFRNDDATICGWYGVLSSGAGMMLTFSETESGQFVEVKRGPAGTRRSLAQPPNVDLSWISWDTALKDQVRTHRERREHVAPGATWKRAETAEEAMALCTRQRDAIMQWRKSQPEAALLDADLHAVLGDSYKTYAARLTQALSAAAG